ncbi:MAG: pectate lyase [Candidatus Latescibacterota bacterium]
MKKIIFSAAAILFFVSSAFAAAPTEKEVSAAMRKASDFMLNTVSCRGGYLWSYAADLSDQWGEAPARKSQIWVQGATPEIGECFLRVYRATGDEYYLRAAEKAADALIYGQHPSGGWHYVIDFEPQGLKDWYEKVFSKFRWGMEEYRHNWGNCTYDDDNTQGATRFLLHLFMTTHKPEYGAALRTALDFMLKSQYPNGAWPQRYPLRYEFAHDGLPDYTHYYTLNDNSMRDILFTLIEAWEQLGDERYREAARRGADFIIAAQVGEPQTGWAEQYDLDMQPTWARTHEPAGLMPRQTVDCIGILQRFYLMTGDRRYLKPIPDAIKWMRNSAFVDMGNGRFQLARYYEAGTNKPIYQHKTEKVNELGYGIYHYDSDSTGVSGGWIFTEVNIGALEKEYARVSAIPPERAAADYDRRRLEQFAPRRNGREGGGNAARTAELIAALDSRGAWVEDIRVFDVATTMQLEDPRKTIKGIAVSSFIENMGTLANYYQGIR